MDTTNEVKGDKSKITLNYLGSGIHTLITVSIICYVFSGIFMIANAYIINEALSSYGYIETHMYPLIIGISIALFFFIAGAICKVIAEIGRTNLIKRQILERDYDIK